jgi:hypothetical protein
MTPFQFIIDAGVILFSGGVFLAINNLLLSIIEFLVRVWRKAFRSWAGRRLREMGIILDKPYQVQAELDWKRLLLVLGIPVLAMSVHDLMLSPMVILFGLAILLWANFQKRQAERAQINEDAEMVALQIRALMSVDHSILNALSRVELPNGRLKQVIDQVANRLRMHQQPEQAAQAFKGLPGTVTGRLSALIAHSAHLTDEIQDDLLLSLEQEAHRQKLLRSKTHQTLALVRGTIRLLQAVVAGSILFVVLTPAWRDFFLQAISHRVLLAVLISASALASLYFEFEVYQLGYGEGS